MNTEKIYFFGWTNFKWICRELNKMYSGSEVSFYSKNRIESGIAFIFLQYGMMHWLAINIHGMSASEMAIWAGLEMFICGYYINKIKSKDTDTVTVTSTNEEAK